MTRRVEMVHVMRALDSVLGAPTVTSNQGAALAAFLNDQVAVEVKPVTWGVVAPWYARNEQMLKDVGKFEGVKGIALEVWRGATEELRQDLAARDEVIEVLKKRRGKGASAHRRYVDNLKARHKAELDKLVSLVRDIDKSLDAKLDQTSLGYDIERRMAEVLRSEA